MKTFSVRATLTLLIFITLLYLLRQPILKRIGQYPVVASPLQASELIVVMSGALPEIHYGIDLYKQGLAPKLLFVGQFPVELAVISKEPFEVMQKDWDEIALHYAVTAGVKEEDVLTTDAFTFSTYERVANMLDVVRQNKLKSAIVVSDLLHTRRIASSARQIDESITVLTAPVPQEYYPEFYRFHADSWWQHEADLKDVFSEYVKLLFYAVGYR